MEHMLLKWAAWLSWLITCLVTINVGLRPFGFDFFNSTMFIMNMASWAYYVILIAGLYSAVRLVMSFTTHCDKSKDSCC